MELLLINNANLNCSAGDITLMCRRADAMKSIGINTTFMSVVNKNVEESYNHKRYNNIKIINTNPENRITDITEYIKIYRPDIVCFYGNKTLIYFNRIKRFIDSISEYSPKIFLDMQGAIEECIDFKSGISYIRELPIFLIKKLLYSYCLSKADGVLSVTDEMYNYCKRISRNSKLINIKLRCGINEVLSIEDKINYRKEYRELLNIKDNEIVLCFSGYRSSWQNIDKIIEYFKRIDKKFDNVSFAFFCNIDSDFLKLIEKSFPKKNTIVKFLNQEEYNKHLCACDVGFLIRDNNTTNKVAFPNKFSDYLNTGLLCCISDYLAEPISILKDCNINYSEDNKDIDYLMYLANKRHENLQGYYYKTEVACIKHLQFESQFKTIDFSKVFDK